MIGDVKNTCILEFALNELCNVIRRRSVIPAGVKNDNLELPTVRIDRNQRIVTDVGIHIPLLWIEYSLLADYLRIRAQPTPH